MSAIVLTNAKLYLNEFDLSGQLNAIAADMSAETPEITTFGMTTKARLGGLKDSKISLNGYFDSEPVLFPLIGAATNPAMTIAPTGADGETCWLFRPAMAKYSPGGKVGDVFAYKVEGEGSGPFVQGTILLPNLARIVTGAGVGRQLGAVTATQRLYAALHVFAKSGSSPTLDVVVESDAANTFLTPAAIITFAQKTLVGSEWKEVAGPNTDDWWRISYTIGGGTPSFSFAVIVGIL